MKVRELFSDESKWTQGADARNALGEKVMAEAEDAVCWCLFGAVQKCYGFGNRVPILVGIEQDLKVLSLGPWNDSVTFEVVKALVVRLDI